MNKLKRIESSHIGVLIINAIKRVVKKWKAKSVPQQLSSLTAMKEAIAIIYHRQKFAESSQKEILINMFRRKATNMDTIWHPRIGCETGRTVVGNNW